MQTLTNQKPIWVIKIGGSLMGTPQLAAWLQVLADLSDCQIIIVPGGGVFADAVRQAQILTQISDASAHRLAVLAMDQYGLLLASLQPQLSTVSSVLALDGLRSLNRAIKNRAMVWLPSQMVLADDTIAQNWDVTSDSLAAWLAHKIGAQHLILIKSVKPNQPQISIESLRQSDLVDDALTGFIQHKQFKTWVLAKDDYAQFAYDDSAKTLADIACLVNE